MLLVFFGNARAVVVDADFKEVVISFFDDCALNLDYSLLTRDEFHRV